MEISRDAHNKYVPDSHPVDHWRVGIPIIYPHYCMPPWAHIGALWLMSIPSGSLFLLKDHIDLMIFSPFSYLLLTKIQCLSSSWAPIYFIVSFKSSRLKGWLVDYLKVKASFPYSMLEYMELVNLGRLSGDYLPLYYWRNNLDEKLAFTSRMDFMADMATCAKRSVWSSTLVMPYLWLSLSWILFPCLSP